jgi:hypothetical protein
MRAQAARVSPYMRTRIAAHRGSPNMESILCLPYISIHTGDFCVVASKITGEKDKVNCGSEFNGWSDLLAHPTDTKAPGSAPRIGVHN